LRTHRDRRQRGRTHLVGVLSRLLEKNLHTWIGGYVREVAGRARAPRHQGPRHLLFAFCDHFEPLWRQPGAQVGEARVQAWRQGYPRLAARFRDADGRAPRHSFFFPGEEYSPLHLEGLAELARAGLGEVELHLHHDGDTETALRQRIGDYLRLYQEHGHLTRVDGKAGYAFIHGNWCLANARRDGRWCGVDRELPLLFDTGCYADFTFPAAPDESQPGVVNQIYWPMGDLERARPYERGLRASVGHQLDDRILMIEGPLAISRRPGRLAVRIENSAVTADDPASASRVATWVDQNIHVAGRPEWVFVKVHTHGAPEKQAAALLGEGGVALHEALKAYNDGQRWRLHYVTAREMYNVALAAMAGKSGEPAAYFDYKLKPPPVVTA
jgi:hypothetical protein